MNRTTLLIADLARLRRIETAARAVVETPQWLLGQESSDWLDAMRELRKVLTEG